MLAPLAPTTRNGSVVVTLHEGGITVTNPEIARTTRCSLGDWHLLRVIDFRPSTHTVLIESSATLLLKFISYNANSEIEEPLPI